MRPRDLHRYLNDVGWPQSPVPPDSPSPRAVPAAADPPDTLDALSEKRQTVVFGEGDPRARGMFIGEGPGADEDRTGRPFVGQAGKLLDRMIFAMGFDRADVYIANVVKCRPPGNRDPKDDEVASCAPYLDRQIDLIQPAVLVALGKPASHRLTGTTTNRAVVRGPRRCLQLSGQSQLFLWSHDISVTSHVSMTTYQQSKV